MRQAIVTKYLCPTNHRGARVKATCEARSLTLPWDHALNGPENHARAAEQLATELDWTEKNTLIGGVPPRSTGIGCVFVLIPKAAV